jgi:hypothetical protein
MDASHRLLHCGLPIGIFVDIAHFVEVTGFNLFQVCLVMQCHLSAPQPAEIDKLVFTTGTQCSL